MNTQPGMVQLAFPWAGQLPLQPSQSAPEPRVACNLMSEANIPDWDQDTEPHPDWIGLHILAVYPKVKR